MSSLSTVSAGPPRVRITRLHLRNFRVYEEPLDLELPPGLVGIYGPNGAGKSALLEAIVFTLWGGARTNKDEVRTAGIVGDCVTEVEFEHEGHLYLVRRSIVGASASVRAQAQADGAQVSEGVRETGRYVHSVLGMDEASFKASVFAEQKQLAAFSVRRPAERRDLVLGLLGITPLDAARDQARKDAKEKQFQLGQLRTMLADIDQIESELDAERAAAAAVEASLSELTARSEAQASEAERCEVEHARLDSLGREFDALMAEGRARRTELDGLTERALRLETESQALEEAEVMLPGLESEAARASQALAQLALVDAAARALAEVEQVESSVPVEPPRSHPETLAGALELARAAQVRLSELEGRRLAALEARDRAAQGLARAAELSHEADCPLCGQALGGAFEAVQAHRRADLEAAEAALGALGVEAGQASSLARESGERARTAQAELSVADAARVSWDGAVARLADAQGRLERVIDAALAAGLSSSGGVEPGTDDRDGTGSGGPGPQAPPSRAARRSRGIAGVIAAGRDQLAAEAASAQRCASEAATLRGRLERRPALERELGEVTRRAQELEVELADMREKRRGLGYRAEDLAAAARARLSAQAAARAAAQAAQAAQLLSVAAGARVAACVRRLEDALEQHRRLAELGDQARHLGRTSELLGAFRNVVVGSVGPRLSAQANDLFGQLTDHEYDNLEVDPETYEIRISDHGSTYGMDRFSGSETDLANLALRVAISEQVTLLSGGAVGLLVLDEVFGPLDSDRKERLVLALERLKGRFRQVLVVTHDNDMKEQLPSAIEVVKLPGRRATARVL